MECNEGHNPCKKASMESIDCNDCPFDSNDELICGNICCDGICIPNGDTDNRDYVAIFI